MHQKCQKTVLRQNALTTCHRDLAVSMRRLLGDWFRVVQLLKTGNSGADDRQLEEAWNAIGDIYAEQYKWEHAVTYYKQGHNHARLAEAYYALEDYDRLENLTNSIPDGDPLLEVIGSMFASVGMCSQAVQAYRKCNRVKAAIDICVTLNEWNTAIDLAKEHSIREIDSILSKYAQHLLEEDKLLSAVELYKKANNFLDAAQLMYKVAAEASKDNHAPLMMKKIYVLGATLVEQHQSLTKKLARTAGSKSTNDASLVLNALLSDDSSDINMARTLDQPWHGAEAYHFFILAQKQLYEGFMDAAMKTALHLRDYEDILGSAEIYSLIALTSCTNQTFGICSKAFIKLESLATFSEDQQNELGELAIEIFMKKAPKDSKVVHLECPNCESTVSDYGSTCSGCGSKFPICVATGRPILDTTQHWTCNFCKHSAYSQDMIARQTCPLCHTPKSEVE